MTQVHYVPHEQFAAAFYRLPHEIRNSGDKHLTNILCVATLFAETIEKHNLTIGSDVQFQVTDLARVEGGTPTPYKCITLTVLDQSKVVEFKLSPAGGVA